MKAFEQDNQVSYLGFFKGANRYVPTAMTVAEIRGIAEQIAHPVQDTGDVRVAIYQLWLTTKHEKMNEQDRDAMLMTYVERCARYPQAAVLSVIETFSETKHFFPSWAEFKAALDEFSGWRASMVSALRRLATNKQKDTPND